MRDKDSLRVFELLAMACLLLLVTSSLIFYHREQAYVRPESYFYLLSLASAIVFTQVLFLRENFSPLIKFTFFMEILLIGLSFVLTQQFLYKTVLGRDPWYHWVLVEKIVRRAHIPPYNEILIPYVKMPNFHLLIASGIILANLNYKWAQLLFVGLPTLILLILGVYLYSKKLFGSQVALASILLVAISDNVLDMVGKSIIPNSMGVALAFLTFYLIYFGNLNNDKIKFIAILLATSLVFTHTVSFSFLIWQVLVISILALIFKENVIRGYLTFLGFLIVLAFFEWALYSGFYLKPLTVIFKSLFIYGFGIERYKIELPVAFLDVLVARLGMMLYFTIAGMSLLRVFIQLLKKRFRDRLTLSNVIATGGIVAGVATFLIPALAGISHRFWYYGEVLSSAFVGSLLVNFIKNRNKNWRKIVLVIFIALLSLSMFKANISNDDNPLVPYYSQRTGWYDSELEAGKFIVFKEGHIPFGSDWDYSANLGRLKTNLVQSEILEDINRVNPRTFEEVKNCNCIFVFRRALLKDRLFYLGELYSQTPYLPMKNLTIVKELSKHEEIIYNNRNVVMILIAS